MWTKVPTLIYPLVIYNLLGFFAPAELDRILFSLILISGSDFTFTVNHLFLLLGIIALTVEVIKSTSTSTATVIDHGLSLVVFIVFLLEFILVRFAGTPEFLILTLMALADVITGFTVTIFAARRDFAFGGNHPSS